eukprot:XP_015580258.1 uncharacterized protein LOC107261975 [Ricinus communis]
MILPIHVISQKNSRNTPLNPRYSFFPIVLLSAPLFPSPLLLHFLCSCIFSSKFLPLLSLALVNRRFALLLLVEAGFWVLYSNSFIKKTIYALKQIVFNNRVQSLACLKVRVLCKWMWVSVIYKVF